MQRGMRERLGWAALLVLGAGVLALSRWLTPSAAGFGTHTQLGLPPCGFLQVFGIPCPACGLTTAFAHAAHFSTRASLAAHPLGLPLFLALCALCVRALLGVCGLGSVRAFLTHTAWPRLMLAVALAMLAAWSVRLLCGAALGGVVGRAEPKHPEFFCEVAAGEAEQLRRARRDHHRRARARARWSGAPRVPAPGSTVLPLGSQLHARPLRGTAGSARCC